MEVIKFLEDDYGSDFFDTFNLERTIDAHSDSIVLIIKVTPRYAIKISTNSMKYLFELYCAGDFIPERGQFTWQKELVDMIEGG